ncbi:hypothetical protein G9A89_017040 [Geosiphon pyriformis]|nr:hypothetical protein G9A89_017040 [Geosiphon pyriformis]
MSNVTLNRNPPATPVVPLQNPLIHGNPQQNNTVNPLLAVQPQDNVDFSGSFINGSLKPLQNIDPGSGNVRLQQQQTNGNENISTFSEILYASYT